MNDAEVLIRTMGEKGSSAKRIAEELYDRGMKNGFGRPYTAEMVDGYLRYTGLEEGCLAARQRNKLSAAAVRAATSLGVTASAAGRYSKEAEPIADPLPKVRMLRPWPMHTDFKPDELDVRN
jgi:hypothetical protein